MFDGQSNPLKQCTVAGAIGQKCDVASCTGGVACSGGPPATCASGVDSGKFCCQTAAGATCAIRDPTPCLKAVDYNSATSHALLSIAGNTFFGGSTDKVDIDFQSPGTLANQQITDSIIVGNLFAAPTATNTIAIRMPPVYNTVTNLSISGNNFGGYMQDVANWKAGMGSLSFVPITIGLASDQTTATFANFVDIPGLAVQLDANRSYFFTCEITFSSSAATTGIGLSMTGPTYTNFSIITRLPTASVATGAGTDTMQEQEGNGPDSTAAVSAGVGAAVTPYMANMRGNIVTTAAGLLQARFKAENGSPVSVLKGSNCLAFQVSS